MDPASEATAAQQREGDLFIREVWGLTGTAIVFVFIRYYARLKAAGFKGLTADDYLMLPATVSGPLCIPSSFLNPPDRRDVIDGLYN